MSDQEAIDDIDKVKEDCSDVDVDVNDNDNEEKPLPANISLIISKYCIYEDDEPWEIRTDSSSSDECDADLPTCSKLFQADNPKTEGTEKKLLVPNKTLKNSISVNSRLNKNLDNGQDFSKTNKTLSDLLDSTLTNLPDPSCLTDLAGPSNSTDKLHLVSDLPESNVDKKLITKVLMNVCDKSYLTDSFKPMTTPKENVKQNQDVSVIPIEKCHCLKGLPTNLEYSSRKGSDSQMKNSQCFVEDDDFVNPDILYNIDLNEHYKQMDLLVQKIVRITDDQTRSVLDECMQLPPIPRIEHEKKTFTAKERFNFLHGIREWEYEIDGDDWNKIMVKRAVIFTAHAGFSIANEESLYVLADVAIDYIKKLAIILKRNFDIQSNSSYPDLIDPITNSLREIGVNGGIDELIKHYENDVYERRNKLMKKCQHLQKIVDQFVERADRIEPKIKNQYVVKHEPREESTARDIRMEMDATQTTVEGGVRTEPQSTTDASAFANAEMELTEPVYVDGADNEADADAKTVENVRRVPTDVGDGRADRARTASAKTREFDLLKPFTGYVFHEPKTWGAADTGKADRKPPNVWKSRNKHVFDIRDYERPYNIAILNQSRSFAGRSSDGGRAVDRSDGSTCATKIIRLALPSTSNIRGGGRPAAFRTELSDLEDSFKRFTWCRAQGDVPPADHDDRTSSPDEMSADHDDRTSSPGEMSVDHDDRTSSPGEMSVDHDDRTSSPGEMSVDHDDRTSSPGETSAGTTRGRDRQGRGSKH